MWNYSRLFCFLFSYPAKKRCQQCKWFFRGRYRQLKVSILVVVLPAILLQLDRIYYFHINFTLNLSKSKSTFVSLFIQNILKEISAKERDGLILFIWHMDGNRSFFRELWIFILSLSFTFSLELYGRRKLFTPAQLELKLVQSLDEIRNPPLLYDASVVNVDTSRRRRMYSGTRWL